ncbi:MAG: hypothetical protein P8X98_06310 [Woeseiaceae bacterium]
MLTRQLVLMVAGALILHEAPAAGAVDPLFQDDEVLEMTISAPIATILRERSTEQDEPGTVSITSADGSIATFEVRFRARGNFRRETCRHPPAWLNFKRSDVAGTLFENQNKLKLVVHCDRSALYDQLVVKEYLAYRIFNELTDNSFRVRLLRVTYVDSETGEAGAPRYAFLIEHKNRLAARLGLRTLDIRQTSVSALDPVQLNLAIVFQYFIGNTDFSPLSSPEGASCCHNFMPFSGQGRPILPIPYDFDQAGFVAAPYASPHPRLRLKDVRTRMYRGYCANNDRLAGSLQRFRDKRDTIYALIADTEGLESSTRKRLVAYTDRFYKLIESPRDVSRRLERKCREVP